MEETMFVSNHEIGAALRRRRKALKLSQEALADIIGISHQQVQRYEYGSDRLNVVKLQELAQALSVPVSYFFTAERGKRVADEGEFLELIDSFTRIQKKDLREMVIEFAKTCALQEDDEMMIVRY